MFGRLLRRVAKFLLIVVALFSIFSVALALGLA